ncbi:unnamed protein product, partial [Mesorhabditis belari]|uniref:Protein PTHB1 n=1 Tax=Mesorhabditis belari TaxID=2138241 RepID=A0AAF3EAD3_9BILA
MSLFKLNEWYSNIFPTATSIATGELTKGRDQLCVGTEEGLIIVVDPGGNRGRGEESVLVQHHLNLPIIQLAIGEFVSAIDTKLLAVLCPHHLLLFRLVQSTSDGATTKLEEVYTHALTEASYNMCAVPGRNPQLFVQGVSCSLTLFQGEECVFQRAPIPALHPGPLVYCKASESLLITNAGRINSVKFSLLASVSNTGKKITFDWSLNVGDMALDMVVAEWPAVQPSIIVLCRRIVFCLTSGGNVRYTIHLEAIGLSLLVYNTLNSSKVHMCIATSINTVLLYSDNDLIWNFQMRFPPVQMKLGNFSEPYQNLLSFLSSDGRVVTGYLGTEPSLYRLPLPPTRFVDFEEKNRHLSAMEKALNSNSSTKNENQASLQLRAEWDSLDRPSRAYNVPSDVPSLTLRLSSEDGNFANGHYQVNVRSSFQIQQNHFVLTADEFPLSIILFINPIHPPTSLNVHITVHHTRTQLSGIISQELPLELLFRACGAERNANYKITIDADRAPLSLPQIFPEMNSENPVSLGLQVYGSDAIVSVFTANKSNRYRIQSDHAGLLLVVAKTLADRIRNLQPNVHLTAPIPLEYLIPKFEEYLEFEEKYAEERKEIERKTKEMRAINALIVTKTRSAKQEPTAHIDMLFNASHEKLISMLDAHMISQDKLRSLKVLISSLLGLLGFLLALNGVDTQISAYIFADTNQGVKERLAWASNSYDNDVGRMLNALCHNTAKQLSNITEEEEDEEDYQEKENEKNEAKKSEESEFALGSHQVATSAQPPIIFHTQDDE